jgi:hypothetical protein
MSKNSSQLNAECLKLYLAANGLPKKTKVRDESEQIIIRSSTKK